MKCVRQTHSLILNMNNWYQNLVKKKLIIKFSVLNPMAIKVVVITKLSEPGVRKERTEQKPILLHR